MSYTYSEIRRKASLVRNTELTTVLKCTGSIQDCLDKKKWHTNKGVISVTGQQFYNWNAGSGGGGAIDLVIHLKECDFKSAVSWLSNNFISFDVTTSAINKHFQIRKLDLPQRHDEMLPRIKYYLKNIRCIPENIINMLICHKKLYADKNGNCVFLLLGKKKITGAEIRGTGKLKWHSMAAGSNKNFGYFFIKSNYFKNIVLCESAIDAVSYFVLSNECMAISTSGTNSNPTWLADIINIGYNVYCGFDADDKGDEMADKLLNIYPGIKRIRPFRKDWNEILRYKVINQK